MKEHPSLRRLERAVDARSKANVAGLSALLPTRVDCVAPQSQSPGGGMQPAV